MKFVLTRRKLIALLLCVTMLFCFAPFGPLAAFGEDGGISADISSGEAGTDSGDTAGDSSVDTGSGDTNSTADETTPDDPTGGSGGDETTPDDPTDENGEDETNTDDPIGGTDGDETILDDSTNGTDENGNNPDGTTDENNENNENNENAAGNGDAAEESQCTCGAVEGEAHAIDCPLYEEAVTNHMEGCSDDCTDENCICPCHQAQQLQCTCGAAEGEAHAVGCPLFVHLEGCSDECTAEDCTCPCHQQTISQEEVLALYEQWLSLETDEEIEAFLAGLSEAQLKALEAYIISLKEPIVPETVVFTEAGPFLPPVEVDSIMMFMTSRLFTLNQSLAEDDNGLILDKTATANEDGSYQIRLEAYTTGNVTTTETTVPVDIVLVLDQSGSMAFDFNGNSTNTNTDRRQYAMKQAVNNFIASVAEKYSDEADHRMAIVTFGSNASTLQGWTYVDDMGKTSLQGEINNLPDSPSGATNVAAGMQQAETLMNSGYSYTGTHTERQKVVIVFTDGVPTTQTDFDTTVATNAIKSAKKLKDSGVTVYSVGIFNGANPEELHGEKWDYTVYTDISCSGDVGSYWGGSWLSELVGSNDFEGIDIAAGNRFLNYLSSNSTNATEIGLERGTFNPSGKVGGSGTGYKITANYNCSTGDGYYLTANDSTSLNNIFQTISDNIQTSNIDLGSETVIKDIVTDYFDLPDSVDEIYVYTSDYDGSNFDTLQLANGVQVNINEDSKTVSVSGFDYNANFVTDTAKSDGSFGAKLIIEFTVTPREGFLGGNGVPTNGADSGVYVGGTSIENFNIPEVNVPIPEIVAVAADKNVYLCGDVTSDDLTSGAKLYYAQKDENGNIVTDKTAYATGTEIGRDWQDDFVIINSLTVAYPENLATLTGGGDTTYSVNCTIDPINRGTVVTYMTHSAAGNVYVFRPELTFKDEDAYYGDNAPTDFSGNLVSTVWKHGDTKDIDVTMIGVKPVLSITYAPDANMITDGKINTKQDVPVDVTIKIGDTDVTQYTTFMHNNCADKTCTVPSGSEFLLHINTCILTVQKTGGADDEPYVFVIKKDGTEYSQVTVKGNRSETIYELPVGTYTIQEDTGWSWRYTASDGDSASLTAQNHTRTVTCTNAKTQNYWLNGYSQVIKNVKN